VLNASASTPTTLSTTVIISLVLTVANKGEVSPDAARATATRMEDSTFDALEERVTNAETIYYVRWLDW
jgi:hypothetical protein